MQFDYIIIGGGSAGCVLANRLTETGQFTVCLLEAGSDAKSFLVNTPGLFAAHMFTHKFNWAYESKPKADIRQGKSLFVPRGKGLGGSSSINAMVYIRGQKQDYDHWAELGNVEWGYDKLLPYFKKAETNENGACKYHGDDGPLYVSNCDSQYPLTEVFIEAAQQAGFPYSKDFNAANQEGIGCYQFTIKDGQRCGAAKGYLMPALERANLTVITQAQASKIVFSGNRAVAVEYERKGKQYRIDARAEIIVSSGAINSPQLLMLSGIGDKQHLDKFNIPCITDLPGVGQNLREHVDACVLVASTKKDGFTANVAGLAKMAPEVLKYLNSRTGKLANSMTESGGFLKSSEQAETPDVQYHFVPLLFDDCGRDLKLMSNHGYSLHVCVLRPESTGSICLASGDIQEPPVIDFNFFSDAGGKDKQVLIDGIRQARKILSSPAFESYRGIELHPGIEVQEDEDIFSKAKETLGLVYHPSGTCKMGDDPLAVVDQNLKVHGTLGLRVVDGSVMPTLISGNTNAPIIAIAEKAACMILSCVEH